MYYKLSRNQVKLTEESNFSFNELFHVDKKVKKYPTNKFWKILEAHNRAKVFLALKGTKLELFNLLLGLKKIYRLLIPSQGWLAKQLGCDRVTVCNLCRELHEAGLIKKVSRGLAVWNKKTGVYKSKTCEYSHHDKLIKNLRYIASWIPQIDPLIEKLISRIPDMKKLLLSFFTLISLFFIYINKKDYKDYITNEYVTIKGEYNYEISKLYKTEELIPTSTVTVPRDELKLIMADSIESQEIENACAETLPYTESDILSRWSRNLRTAKNYQKGKELPYPYRPYDHIKAQSYKYEDRTYGGNASFGTSKNKACVESAQRVPLTVKEREEAIENVNKVVKDPDLAMLLVNLIRK